jgi:uncharacterized membrane protein YfcA
MIILGYIFTIFIGFTLGAIGSGGSIFLIPNLMLFFHYPKNDAIAIAYIITGITAFLGTMRHYHLLKWNWQYLYFIIPATITTWLTHHFIVPFIPQQIWGTSIDHIFIIILAILMIFSAIGMWKHPKPNHYQHNELITIFMAIFYGALVGILGTGGGFLLVPTFIIFLHMEFQQAVEASLALIMLTCISGVLADRHILESLASHALMILISLCILGMVIGQKMHEYVSDKVLKQFFIGLVLLTALFIFLHEFTNLVAIEQHFFE